MNYKSEEEFHAAAHHLLESVEKQAKGEISEKDLIAEWKVFMKAAQEYLDKLGQSNPRN